MPKGKGILALALGDPKMSEEDDDMDTQTMAAKDLRAAIKSGDDAALVDAFQRMYDACSLGGDDETMEE